jgi:hypothetical protein
MSTDETTCGEEMAADAEVPEKLGRLMAHVAENMEAHARWAATDRHGQREHDDLMAAAREYRSIADACGRAAVIMRSMHDLPATPHDPTRLDRAGHTRWMRAKIAMQVEFADLLRRHAELSKKVVAAIEAPTPPVADSGPVQG